MSQLSRRSALLAVPATTATLVAATAEVASATPDTGRAIMTFTVRRARITLPSTPVEIPIGTTYIAFLELLNDNGVKIGDGSVRGAVVDIIPAVPPKLVVQASTIYRFPEGEIHASNMHIRQVPNPGVKHFVAITGGTGDYRTARGSGTIEYATANETKVVLNVITDPPAPGP